MAIYEIYTKNPETGERGWGIEWVRSEPQHIKSFPNFDRIITTNDFPVQGHREIIQDWPVARPLRALSALEDILGSPKNVLGGNGCSSIGELYRDVEVGLIEAYDTLSGTEGKFKVSAYSPAEQEQIAQEIIRAAHGSYLKSSNSDWKPSASQLAYHVAAKKFLIEAVYRSQGNDDDATLEARKVGLLP